MRLLGRIAVLRTRVPKKETTKLMAVALSNLNGLTDFQNSFTVDSAINLQ